MHKSAMQMQAQDVHNRGGGGVAAGLGLQQVNSNGSKYSAYPHDMCTGLLGGIPLKLPFAETHFDL